MKNDIVIRDSGIATDRILEMIAQGFRYDQILDKYPKLSLADIMAAAAFCLEILAVLKPVQGEIRLDSELEIVVRSGRVQTLDQLRQEFPRAYRPWSENEERQLLDLFKTGMPFNRIAERHKRNVGAIISRLRKLEQIE